MSRLCRFAGFGLLALLALPLHAVEPAAPSVVPPARIQDVVAHSNGKTYRIFISQPSAPPPVRGYPVLYVLDGNATFATLAQTVDLQTRPPHGFAPALVVGIGYPGDEPFDIDQRHDDLTPPTPAHYLPTKGGKTASRVGGAAAFLDFIDTELKPLVEARFAIDRQRQALIGHSLGGLFVLQVLFRQPQSFRYYVASSPSIWWGNQSILQDEASFAARLARLDIKPELKMIVAGNERAYMVDDACAMAERLQILRAQGFRSDFMVVPDENHISVLPQSLNRSVRFVLDGAP